MTRLLAALLLPGLVACAGVPKQSPPAPVAATVAVAALPEAAAGPLARKVSPYAPAQEDPNTRGHYIAGGLYRPGVADSTPSYVPNVELIPEPEVVAEPRSRVGNRASYSVLGKQYHVLDDTAGYAEQGLASYYGSKFHGRRTSNLEVYDMYAFTAAHKTLPLPSFARITNLDNGQSVVVRVNDRGPFHEGRVVDLSYAAAVKLGITQRGTGRVEVRALQPGDAAPAIASAAIAPVPAAAAPAPSASTMDKLLAALPIAGAQASQRPRGARRAAGRPARTDAATPTPPAPAATGMPVSTAGTAAPAYTQAPTTAAVPDSRRFDMNQNGRTMSADEFDAWMTARQLRVVTSAPVMPVATPPAAVIAASTAGPVVVTTASPSPGAGVPSLDDITLQVASFSARGNADRALAMLHGAGIGQARLLDGNANGQQVWRLRVGPLDAAAAPQLASRIAGLGFGPPQRVRD